MSSLHTPAVSGRGEYDQVSSMQHVGQGRGEFTKEKYVARPGGAKRSWKSETCDGELETAIQEFLS